MIYYYYKLYMDGKQFWGNIRLPAGRRDRGVLSFAYFEFKESPLKTGPRLERWKYYTKADGLLVEKSINLHTLWNIKTKR